MFSNRKYLLHRNIKRFKACVAVAVMTAVMLVTLLCPGTVLAERYYGEGGSISEDGSPDVTNHLQGESWVRDGSFMYYTAEGFTSSVGVDVSKWNGDIDWYALKSQGVDFAIIRVGCRGYETGEIVLDDRFYEYMDGASAAGMDIGVYFYSQAIDEDEAVEEAYFVLEHIAGYYVSLPVYFDTEDVVGGASRTDIMATANFNLNAQAFCRTIESNGYRAGVYASGEWIRRNLDLGQLSAYEIWYAAYNDTPGREYGFDMWQYTDSGYLAGCDTCLDMNVRVYRTYWE